MDRLWAQGEKGMHAATRRQSTYSGGFGASISSTISGGSSKRRNCCMSCAIETGTPPSCCWVAMLTSLGEQLATRTRLSQESGDVFVCGVADLRPGYESRRQNRRDQRRGRLQGQRRHDHWAKNILVACSHCTHFIWDAPAAACRTCRTLNLALRAAASVLGHRRVTRPCFGRGSFGSNTRQLVYLASCSFPNKTRRAHLPARMAW